MSHSLPSDARTDAGLGVLQRIELDLGNQHGLLHGMRVHAPRFKSSTIAAFGDQFAGEQLVDERTKLLVALALAAGQAADDGLVEFHVGAALKAAWSRDQVVEVLELVAAYAGRPAALRAMHVAIAAFEKASA